MLGGMLFISRCMRASEIKSMLPSLVYYNWLIVTNAQKKCRSFTVWNLPIFRTSVANVILVDQEWLKPGVPLFCRKKGSIQQMSDDRFNFSWMMATLKSWLKDFSQRTPNYQIPGPWISTVSELRHVGSIWMSRTLLKWACWLTTEIGCVNNCCVY